MSTTIKLRRSAVQGRIPTTAQLSLGEVGINTRDGKIYIKQHDSAANTSSIVAFSADPADLLTLIKTVDGAGSGLDADLLDGLNSLQFLRSDQSGELDGSLTVTGDFTVSGNTTYVNTETIQLSDNIITLNANHTGAPTQHAGIEIERGDESNVTLQWNETGDYWEIASGGVVGRILTTGDEGTGNGIDSDTLDGEEGTYYLDFTNTTNKPDPQINVALTGKVTGTGQTTLTDLQSGSISITTELANTAVAAGSYGNATTIPVITVDEDGRLTNVSTTAVAGVDSTQWYNANNTYQIVTGDGSSFDTLIDTFADITVNGNVAVTGTVDGRDILADGTKLDGIEAGASGDMTAAEILTALLTVDGTGTLLDADKLDGEEGSYYLDYDNFTGVPAARSNTEIFNIVLSSDGTGSLLDADKLDGQEGTYYLDYANFTSTPNIFDVVLAADGTGSLLDADKLDGQEGTHYLDFTNFTNLPDPGVAVALTGKVTGSGTATLTDLGNGSVSIATELANTAVTAGSYGSASAIPVITVDEDGRLTAANTVAFAGIASVNWHGANTTLVLEGSDGTNFLADIHQFGELDVTGNITISGTVDGRDVSVDGAKLDLIEASATADQTAAEILAALITVDGTGTLLDADLLDGQHAQDIIDAATAAAGGSVGNATITITAGNALGGGGTFTANQFANSTITVDHANTSTQVSVLGSNGQVIQDVVLDVYGHVTGLDQVDFDSRYYTQALLDAGQLDNRYYTETELNAGQLDNRYYTETELDAGQLDNRYFTETEVTTALGLKVDKTQSVLSGTGLAGGGALSGDVTLTHADTSSVANTGSMDLNTAEIIDSLEFDEFGHVVSFTTGNLNVLTIATADARYVNVVGDTMTGDLTVPNLIADKVILDEADLTSGTATTSFPFATTIYQFSETVYNSAELVITATDGTNRHITKLLVIHDGTTAFATEFATIYTNASLATYDVSMSGGNVIVNAVAASSNSTTYNISATLLKD